MRSRKRSSCASGSGKVPSYSIGFSRRQDDEGLGQRVRHAVDGDLLLFHRLEQGGLGLGRGAVDLVGQDDLGHDRARPELELVGLLVEDR